MKKKYLIETQDEGKRALTFLRERLEFSKRAIKRGVDRGALSLNGVFERFSSVLLQRGDQLEFDLSKVESTGTKAPFSLPILYEDNSLLFCLKPSGCVTDTNLFQRLLKIAVFLVHRLDKETSGVILLAKTKKMQGAIETLFKKREVKKSYIALVSGKIKKERGVIKSDLEKKCLYQGQSIWGSTRNSGGLSAITHWKCLKKGNKASLVECHPKTGRTHQLRVHLSEMGHPILGDYQYGKRRVSSFPSDIHRLCLHAYHLSLIHPEMGKKLGVTAPLPEIFNRLNLDK